MSPLIRISRSWDLLDVAHERMREAFRAGDARAYVEQLLERAWAEMLMRDLWLELGAIKQYTVWGRWFCEDLVRAETLVRELPLTSRPARSSAA